MTILGLDQSYTGFGFALNPGRRDKDHEDCEVWKMSWPAAKYDGQGERLWSIYSTLKGLLAVEEPELILMEGYSNASKFGREMAGELGGAVKMAVYKTMEMNPLVVPPTTLKKFVTGSGNAPKNVMLQQVYKRWGKEFTDDNMADAFSLVMFGKAWLGEDLGLPKQNMKALEEFRKKRGESK